MLVWLARLKFKFEMKCSKSQVVVVRITLHVVQIKHNYKYNSYNHNYNFGINLIQVIIFVQTDNWFHNSHLWRWSSNEKKIILKFNIKNNYKKKHFFTWLIFWIGNFKFCKAIAKVKSKKVNHFSFDLS